MEKPKFVYVTYIRTTPEKLWSALIDPEFTRQYWVGTWQECTWEAGASWKIVIPGGGVTDSGHVVEINPPRRLVLAWKNEIKPEMRDEPASRMTYELKQDGEMVKLTVIHESEVPDSKIIKSVSNGWPLVLSSLKSLLETGESFVETRVWPSDGACIVETKAAE